MAKWLLKTEPETYSWDDLAREGAATWNGITNAVALKNIRSMKRGDLALIYHTGKERKAVGIAQVTSNPYPDPDADDERIVVIDLKAKVRLKSPVTLDTIKSDPAFKSWDLVRNSRLSVVPVPDALWARLEKLSKA